MITDNYWNMQSGHAACLHASKARIKGCELEARGETELLKVGREDQRESEIRRLPRSDNIQNSNVSARESEQGMIVIKDLEIILKQKPSAGVCLKAFLKDYVNHQQKVDDLLQDLSVYQI